MSLNINLKDRLRNTNHPETHTIFPLFEAVVNSIHSIDERIDIDKQFEIVDNRIGFYSKNYKSFQTYDFEQKIN
jgi:hypothetical protein